MVQISPVLMVSQIDKLPNKLEQCQKRQEQNTERLVKEQVQKKLGEDKTPSPKRRREETPPEQNATLGLLERVAQLETELGNVKRLYEMAKLQLEENKLELGRTKLQLEKGKEELEKKMEEIGKAKKEKEALESANKSLLDRIVKLEREVAKKYQENCWERCHYTAGLTISGPIGSIVRCKANGGDFCTVYAKYSLSSFAAFSAGIFYFEIIIKQIRGLISFGFALKLNNGNYNKTHFYWSDGNVCIDGQWKEGNERFGTGDTVGWGANLGADQFFCAKNGRRIDFANDSSISRHNFDEMIPFVALFASGDEIETNFGPEFVFDISSIR